MLGGVSYEKVRSECRSRRQDLASEPAHSPTAGSPPLSHIHSLNNTSSPIHSPARLPIHSPATLPIHRSMTTACT